MERCEVYTSAGVLCVLCTERGVAGLSLPPRPRGRGYETRRGRPRRGPAGRLSDELIGYFRGERAAFSPPLDLEGSGSFDRRAFAVIRSIPYGEVRSYGWVAGRMGVPGGARAVGGACRRNPCPIVIPCHRVVAAGGGLGGYSGGMAWKRYLLALEKKNKKNI